MALGQKLNDIGPEWDRLLRDTTRQLQTFTRLERERDSFKCSRDELKTKLEGTKNNLSQALAELESTKKNSEEVGCKKGFDAATDDYVV